MTARSKPLDIKICGLKTAEALEASLVGGASYVGFIFFARSPRNIAPEQAGLLRRPAAGRAKAVAVTVDADDAFLDRIVAEMAPDMLQLHGKETPARVANVKARYGLPVIKVFSVGNAEDFGYVQPFFGVADRFMFDARPPKGSDLPGGNGVAFDWGLLAGVEAGTDYLLSGGLNAGNVAEALRMANPPGIDVSSGVERAPGVKDVELIRAFFAAVRAAEKSRAA